MRDERKTREQLLSELVEMRQRVAQLDALEAERKRVEQALRESESKLSSILSSMVDLVFALDSEGRFTFYHAPRFKELLYPSPDDFVGRKHSEVMPAHIHRLFTEAFEKNRQGEVAEYEYRLDAGDRARWFSARLSPVFEDGKFTGSVAVVTDITEHKRANEELQQYTAQLETLRGIVLELTAELDLDTLLHSIASQATQLLGGDLGILHLYRPDLDVLEWIVSVGLDQPPPVLFLHRGQGLCGRVLQSGQPLIVNDYHHWEGRVRGWEGYPFQAVMGVPICWGEELLGVLEISAPPARFFTPADVELLSLFASQAAIAIRNARLYEETRQQSERLAQTLAISEWLHRGLQLELVLEQIAQGTVRLGFRRAVINVCQPGEELVKVQATAGLEGPEREALMSATYRWSDFQALFQERFRVSRSYLIRHGEVDWDRDFQGVVVVPTRSDRGPGFWHPEDMLLVPLWGTQGQPLGLLSVDEPVDGLLPGLNAIRTLEAFANQAAIAIENARLFEEEKRRATQLALISEVGEKAASILDLDMLMQEVIRSIQESFNYYNVSLLLLNEECQELVMQAVAGGFDYIVPGEYRQSLNEGIMGLVARTGRSWLANDTSQDPYYIKGFAEDVFTRSEVAVPIRLGDEIIGVLDVQSIDLNDFDQSDVVAMQAVADRLAVAIQNAQLFAQAEQRANELATLLEAARAVSSTLNLQEVLALIAEQMAKVTGAAGCTLSRWDREADAVVTLTEWRQRRMEMTDEPDTSYALEDFPTIRTVLEKRQPITVLATDPDADPVEVALLRKNDSVSLLMLPLVVGEQAIGLVELDESEREREFTAAEIRLCQALADQAAMAIQNARLYEEARRRVLQLQIVEEVGRKASTILDLDELFPYVTRAIQHSFGYHHVDIFVVDQAAGYAVFKASSDPTSEKVWKGKGLRFKIAEEGVIGRVAHTGQPLLVNDVSQEMHYLPDELLPQTKSELVVPLKVGERVAGVLDVDSEELNAFNEDDLFVLQTLANQVAIAIENAWLHQETLAHSRYLETLQQINATLRSTLPLSQVLETIARGAGEALGYIGTVILIPDATGEWLVQGAVWGGEFLTTAARLTGLEVSSLSLSLAAVENPVARAYLSGELQAWSEAPERIVIGVKPAIRPGLASVMARTMGAVGAACVPLSVGERIVGVLGAFSSREQFPDEERAMLLGLADQAGLAIENARLYEAEQRRRREAETLRETALALTSALDRNRVVERILTQLQEVVPYDSASVQLLRQDQLVIVGGRGFPNLEELLGISFPVDGDNPNREVMRTLSPFILEDAPLVYEGFRRGPHLQTIIRSWLGVPMLIGERPVGMLALDKSEPGFYTHDQARLAQAFAAQAAIAIENARLFEEVEKRRAYLEGVLGAAPDAIVTLDASHRIVEWNPGAQRLFGYSWKEAVGQNIDDLIAGPDVLQEAVGFTQIVMAGLEVPPVETVRYRKDGSPVHVIVAASPIIMGGELIGVVAVYTDITQRKRLEEALRAMALIDDLTGLYNRRGFLALGRQQLKTASRMRSSMLLLFADFDGLKRINDAFGHPAGDQALREVAGILQQTFRESDILGRIGGDEFVVLALETHEDSVEILNARLEENVKARNARGDLRYQLALSVGLARYDPESPCSIDELVAQADRSMYERKRCEQGS